MDFPSVTICNRNIVSCKNLQNFIKTCETKKSLCKNEAQIKELVNLGKCDQDGSEDKESSPEKSKETEDVEDDFFKRREKQNLCFC